MLRKLGTAKVVANSVNEFGDEIWSIDATIPRIILSEVNTHRVFDRSSASSRAIPYEKKRESVTLYICLLRSV